MHEYEFLQFLSRGSSLKIRRREFFVVVEVVCCVTGSARKPPTLRLATLSGRWSAASISVAGFAAGERNLEPRRTGSWWIPTEDGDVVMKPTNQPTGLGFAPGQIIMRSRFSPHHCTIETHHCERFLSALPMSTPYFHPGASSFRGV